MIVIPFAGTAAVAALLAWLFSLEGTKGLGEWGWNRVYFAIAALGLLPLVLALCALAIAAAAAGALAFGASAVIFGFIIAKAHALGQPPPRLMLVDPGKGLATADSGTLRLALSSDPHWGALTAGGAARLTILKGVAAERPARDAFFILGDNTELGMENGQWAEEARDLASNLGTLAVRPLLGNHDAAIDGQYHYRAYFFPKEFRTDSGSPYWYSIDAGCARLVVLDLLWGAEDFTVSKRAWLERTLAAIPEDKRIIVLSHCFFVSSGYVYRHRPWFDHYGTLGVVAPILEKYKVDLVVQGHNHYMEFLERNGVAYATVGSMGGKLDPEPTHVSPWSKWLLRGTWGWLDLEVTVAGISLVFKDSSGKTVHEERVSATRRSLGSMP